MTTDAEPLPWHDLYPSGVNATLTASVPTLLDAWRRHVAERPAAPAVYAFDQSLTFSQMDAASDALASALLGGGMTAGDRVAVYLQNDPQWMVTLLAAFKIGAVVVCMNPMLREAEMRHHLSDAQPKVLVCLDSLYADVLAGMRDENLVERVITTAPWDMFPDTAPPAAYAAVWGERQTFADTDDWIALMRAADGQVPPPVHVSGSDVAMLTYTSGTTGRAKAAMNTHAGMAHSAEVYVRWFEIDAAHDVVLGIAPLFHITGSVAALGVAILSGAPVILLHRFDAAATLTAIERWKATFTVAASTAYNALASHPEAHSRSLGSLTKAASGGAPLSRALVGFIAEQTGWTITGVYGMTETTSPTHLAPRDREAPIDPDSGALSVGIPVPGADVRIVDLETGEPLSAGEAGEITVSGPMVVPGYWGDQQATAAAIVDGRLRTGDVGIVRDDGWLFVVDRKKDLIIAGGYKVWPREVEEMLAQHPSIREAAVVGVPDEYRGETVKAYVSLRAGESVSSEDIIAFAKQNIAAYKYPRIIEIVDELPKNASGKVLRRDLRESLNGAAS
ncbi:AMP-binding protein [Microbacterium sp. AGC85]